MKPITYTSALIAALLACACQTKSNLSETEKTTPDTKSSEQVEEKGACCSEHDELAAGEVSEDSIYQLDATWKDDTGSERKLKSLGGKIQVITMGYSTCKFACPKLLADMRAIEAGLPKAVRSKIHFTFVSIDPETDTPARLSEYRKENKINASRWTLLTGETSSVQELAVVLGIQYRKTTGTDFAHSNLISVLNAQGEVIHRQEGLTADPAATIQAIIQASK